MFSNLYKSKNPYKVNKLIVVSKSFLEFNIHFLSIRILWNIFGEI